MPDKNHQNLQPDQTVLDYILKERIGIGGYGEVWSVEAPGGMMKAAKFVFGFHDEKRAQRELKALDRIKHIRHPFLLSLERIDVVDGRMVVITELADKCLKMRFNECVDQNQIGIERDELLGYLHESADALDYMADSHGLAHLDIKPENMLLVGNHAKVADFGLVKDLQAVNQSLMDGLTPAYAAPELFDGQPGRASDQYSLAILFQEMLTGTRPFSGTTAAQLANQHLHSRPNLNELPRSDQAVVARALSKQSAKRFPSSQAFVEELAKRRNRTRRKTVDPSPARLVSDVNTLDVTSSHPDIKAVKHDVTRTVPESFVPAVKFEAQVEKLEPFNIDESQAEIRPTLFIGVGQTGAQTLRQLRRRISHRYGAAENSPAIRMLCLDVDRRSLFEATMGDEGESLQNHEILHIPLRKPEEYRNNKELDVSWIGRRWIYNIPKSYQTEALRPLGRLAYVDHHEEIYRRIGDELKHLSLPEHLATTAVTMDLLPSPLTPRVMFVGSVAGGTGSGMLLDLAFTTRICMGEQGLTDDHLYGLFSHSTSRTNGDHRLAIANSYSFLSEMYHYNLNGYPGNQACRIPAFDDEVPVFDGTYFVHFGDDLKSHEYKRSVDGLAEYLFTSTCTRCSAFFDLCRESDEFEPGSLKTLGISFIGRGEKALTEDPSGELAERLLSAWLEPQDQARERQDTPGMAMSLFEQTPFSANRLEEKIVGYVVEKLGADPVGLLQKQLNEALLQLQDSQPQDSAILNPLEFAEQFLDEQLGSFATEIRLDTMIKRDVSLCELIDSRIPSVARKIGEELTESVLALIDDPDYRVFGAGEVVNRICEEMQSTECQLESRKNEIRDDLESCQQRMLNEINKNNERGKKEPPVDLAVVWAEHVAELVRNRLLMIIESYKRKLVMVTRNELSVAVKRISTHRQTLDLVRGQIRLPIDVNDMYEKPVDQQATLFRLLVEFATEQCSGLVPDLEERIIRNVLEPEGGLRLVLGEGGGRLRSLPALIKREAHNLISQYLQKLRLDSMMMESGLPAETIAQWIGNLAFPVTPELSKCGGTSRLLIAVPQKAPIASMAGFIQNQMSHEANIIPATCGEFVICLEMDQLPVENMAMTLLQMQPDCAELIERLHSRNDIEWTRLTSLC